MKPRDLVVDDDDGVRYTIKSILRAVCSAQHVMPRTPA